MLRFLPLLFLFVSCAGDPLDVEIIDLKTVVAGDEFTHVDEPYNHVIPRHEELTVRFSFRAEESESALLALQSRYVLYLPDLTIGGLSPATPVEITPGVWQDLELQFIPERDGQPAILAALYLNGSPVYYQQPLTPDEEGTGPLIYLPNKPGFELADFRYAKVAGRPSSIDENGVVQLNLPILRYELYHLPKGSRTFSGWDTQAPVKTGYTNRVDLYNISDRRTDYAIRFTGNLNVPEEDDYYFFTWGPGKTDFMLDGQPIAGHAGAPNDWQSPDSLRLSAGDHAFDLRIVQHHGWNVNRISYRKAGTDEEPRFLNAMEERKVIATPAATNPRRLETDAEPFLLRSFLYFPAPKLYEEATKRTHVISVGEGEGPHYSVDLQTGALLQAWRGDFADVHDMWDGRGEPQVMRPLGPAIQFAGEMLVAPSADAPWPGAPEQPDEDDFHHVAHELDESGRPTFFYNDDKRSISDHIIPKEGGLFREITHTVGGSESYYVQLAAANEITEIAPGEFELRSPGHRIKIESYDGSGLTLQKDGNLQRLIAELPAKGHVRYQIDW